MIISLKTEYVKLQEVFSIPIVGSALVFVLALLPVPLMFIFNEFLDVAETEFIERINAMVAAVWNIFLCWGLRINISFIFIPCWILFSIIGVLRYFYIIGGN